MSVIVAKSAGFCFGVRRAVETAEQAAAEHANVCALGMVVNNARVTRSLADKGVTVAASVGDIPDGATVVIRSHGEPPETYAALKRRGINHIDCTCPYVSKIHELARKESDDGRVVIVLGDERHPEIKGIVGHADRSVVFNSSESLAAADFGAGESYSVVAQTTFDTEDFDAAAAILRNKLPQARIFNTICGATAERQREAAELAERCGLMIVLGDKESSNAAKLFGICKKRQENTFFIGSIFEQDIEKILLHKASGYDTIGITAGASVPPDTLREALVRVSEQEKIMTGEDRSEEYRSDNEVKVDVKTEATADQGETSAVDSPNGKQADTSDGKSAGKSASAANGGKNTFAEMLNDSLVNLHKGSVVRGTVISVVNGEVNVNLNYKMDGIIQKGDFSPDASVDPAEALKPGDPIDVYVIHVNDKDGNVLLSRRLVEAQRGTLEIEEAEKSGAALPGKITEVVKGGCIATIRGVKAFVPSSQVSDKFVKDLTQFVGKEMNFTILTYDKSKRRVVAGRKELAARENEERKERVYSQLEVGKRVTGVVSRITGFGAFIDLGGVDGLAHISQLSWGRVRKVTSVISVGDTVDVTVLSIDREKEKISLSLRDLNDDPWLGIYDKYPIGSIVRGKVVRLVSFGAFVELEPNLDGLIHISQISAERIEKPDDALKVGDIVDVKITAINPDDRRVSLSKKQADAELYAEDGYYDEQYDGQYDEQYDGQYSDEQYDDGYGEGYDEEQPDGVSPDGVSSDDVSSEGDASEPAAE